MPTASGVMKFLAFLMVLIFAIDQSLNSVSVTGVYFQAVGAYILFVESNNDHVFLIEHFKNLSSEQELTTKEWIAFSGLFIFVMAVAFISSMSYELPDSNSPAKIWGLRMVGILSVAVFYAIYIFSYSQLKLFLYDVQVNITKNQSDILESRGGITGNRTRAEFRRVGFAFILSGACFQIFASIAGVLVKSTQSFMESVADFLILIGL